MSVYEDDWVPCSESIQTEAERAALAAAASAFDAIDVESEIEQIIPAVFDAFVRIKAALAAFDDAKPDKTYGPYVDQHHVVATALACSFDHRFPVDKVDAYAAMGIPLLAFAYACAALEHISNAQVVIDQSMGGVDCADKALALLRGTA